ncbi:hypothetical protein DPMN_052001 [Dreissena polymorpha]|uniref:Uncharacterized protein n=1 Tax=Dreissena polymorpha TaxID=45954 RepID=A0A9D4HPH4_DREPO|nr:hypothetical protein DPMN_052001 [Dreissena polymorpha]
MWRVELIKVHLHMKFQSCRWKHLDFRANVKALARCRRTADDEQAMTIPRVFSENSLATNYFSFGTRSVIYKEQPSQP